LEASLQSTRKKRLYRKSFGAFSQPVLLLSPSVRKAD
jgi:hypothetical protein